MGGNWTSVPPLGSVCRFWTVWPMTGDFGQWQGASIPIVCSTNEEMPALHCLSIPKTDSLAYNPAAKVANPVLTASDCTVKQATNRRQTYAEWCVVQVTLFTLVGRFVTLSTVQFIDVNILKYKQPGVVLALNYWLFRGSISRKQRQKQDGI